MTSSPRDFDSATDRLEIVALRQETADLLTVVCRAASGARFRFLPGQAMTLALPIGPAPAFRTFTIASSPTRPETIAFTLRAGAVGGATRWMHDHLRPGMTLAATGPVGRFSLAHHFSGRIALVSGGSGITPMMSMLRWLADRGEATDIVFLHQARRPDAIPFGAELAALDRAMPALTVALAVSTVPPGQGWSGYRGRIDRALVARIMPDLAQREVFCCGPAGFMDAMRRIAAAEGAPPQRFHTETFHPVPLPSPAVLPAITPGTDGLTVQLDGRQFDARPGETIVEAAARAGLVIPTGCRSGLCGTCRLALVSGEVAMQHQGGLTEREERAGVILACSARPLSAIALRPLR